MKFSASYFLGLTVPIIAAQSVTVSYDTTYDAGSTSLTKVSCSDGPNGLITKGFSTFSSLPQFPLIGGVPAVTGWNSPACGTCWQLEYQGNTINVLAVDSGKAGFNIALGAMNQLTSNQGVALGRVTATATQVPVTACGLKA